MYRKNFTKISAIVLLLGMLLSSFAPLRVYAEDAAPQSTIPVDPQVLDEINTSGEASYWIEFKDKVDLSNAYDMGWSERGWYVYEQLTENANTSQKNVAVFLNDTGVKFQSFWINNSILVESSGLNTINALLSFSEIESIQPRKEYILYEPEKEDVSIKNEINAIEPNLTHVNADDVWAMGYTGEGLVVANIDTGVRYSHEALVEEYRGNNGGTFDHDYNWFNPDDPTDDEPRDGNGHGTHTMGTMVGDDGGDNQIGIAPDADWIACAGCPDGSCTDTALLGCGQWIAAPTDLAGGNADPDMRPNVVNNSWGDCGQTYDPWFADVIDAWHAVGTYPVFSNGNASNCGYSEPPGLNTVGNPARSGDVSGVGASGTSNGAYATFSNWGPTDNPDTINPTDGFDTMKPQFIAPGTSIRSSTPGSDSEYQDGWSGTSMAAPHVTGLVALIWQAAPCLIGDYATTETLIEETAVDIVYDDGSGDTPTDFPNFASGWGEIDALAAVEAATGLCGDSTLQGTVTDSFTTEPIPGAKVEITGIDPGNDRTVYTNSSGQYSAAVNEDLYDIAVSKFGYNSDTESDIVVVSESTVTVDFELDELTTAMVSGLVLDGGVEGGVSHGYPLYASLNFSTPGFSETIYTDPFTGEYEIELYLGQAYSVSVSAVPMGYETLVEPFTPVSDPETKDFTLYMAEGTCSAPGYMPDYDIFWDFETDDGGFVIGGTTSFAWGDFTSGPGEGHSGTKGLATNPAGNYNASELGWIESPVIDLSSYGTDTPALQWWDWKHIESASYDYARLDVTKDGGVTWDAVWGPVGLISDTAYNQQTVALDPSYNVADFQFRFYFKSDTSVQYEGWYIDDVGIIEIPMPAPIEVFTTDFDTDDGGFTISGTSPSWEWGEPTTGPGFAYSEPNVWATNLGDNYNSNEQSYITSPVIDLSGYAGLAPTISFMHWMDSESNTWDWGAVEVTKDSGATWQTVFEKFGDVTSWTRKSIQLDASYAVSDFQFRFYFKSDGSGQYAGWFIDDVAVTVAEPVVIAPDCVAVPGGVVAGFVYDDNSLDPIIGADVVSADVATQTFQLPDDPENAGLYWAFQPTTADPEDVEFTASMVNYSSDVRTVSVAKDAVNQQDFYMGTGYLVFDPVSFEVTMGMDDPPQDETLTISNGGSGAADFELFERDGGFTPLKLYQGDAATEKEAQPDQIKLLAQNQDSKKSTLTSPIAMPNADVELILDDGTVENNVGIGGTSEFIFLNRFTPDPGAYPFTLTDVQIYFDDTVSVGDDIVIAVYENTSGNSDPAVGANLLASMPVTVQAATSWNNYTLPPGVIFSGPGDVLIGVVAMEKPGTDYFPAALDETSTNERSWAGWWSFSPPPADLALPPDESWTLIDAYFPGNWLVRGMGSAGGSDVVWLSEDPTTGTVLSEDSVDITVTFDPSMLEQPGDYMAEIMVQHNTPYSYENIDVLLHVLKPATCGTLKGMVSGLEACDVNPTPLEGATVNIYNDGGSLLTSLETKADGTYNWALEAGVYDIEMMMDGYETAMVEDVNVPQSTDITVDQELRLIAPCLSVDPDSLEQWLGPDQTATQILTLINMGAGEASFELVEGEAITEEKLLSEGFEGGVMPPAGGWETVHNGDTIREWDLVDVATYPDFVYEGDYSAWINYDSSAVSDEWLISPLLDVSEKTDLELTFMAISDTLYPGATIKVWVTDETGVPLTVDPLWDLIRDETWSTFEYRMVTVDLSAFDDYGNIRVAWQYVGLDGDSFGLDTVEIGATIDIFSVFDAPMTGKVPSYTYAPETEVLGVDTSKFVQNAGTPGEYIPMATMIDESFEGAFPPAGWTQEINNTYTWEQDDYDPHTGSYYTHVEYDSGLNQQDEWLLTPELNLSEGTLSVWSLGSIVWCRDTYDNCDGNIYLVVGDVGGGDDIFVKNLDEDWLDNWVWTETTIDLAAYLPGVPFRIGFQYIGSDGAEIAIDDVMVDGEAGETFDIPWLSEDPVLGIVPADSSLDVDVTFDSTGLAYGDYYGLLKVLNAPAPTIDVPVALHVIPAPEAFDQNLTTEEDVPLDITLTATDPEGDPLTYMIVDGPTNGTLEYDPGDLPELTYVPNEDYYGVDSFTFKVFDGVVYSNTATVTIEVTSVNYAPQANDDYYEADENSDLVVLTPGVLENDVELDPLDVVIADLLDEPSYGVVVLNEDGSFVYTPDTGFLGEDSFTYNMLGIPPEMLGRSEYSDKATVTINVNTKPVAHDQSLSTDEDVPLDITLTADYITPGPEVWTVETAPASGTLTGTGAALTYTPDQDWYGTDSFTFSVNDGMYDSNSATITIEVLPVNDSPTAVDDNYATSLNTTLNVSAPGVLANDYDVDPTDEIFAEKKTDPLYGMVTVNPDGSFTYTPNFDFIGTDSFEYYMLATPERQSEFADWATVYITVQPFSSYFIPIFFR